MNGQKWYHSNCKNVLPHTKMAGCDKNDRTNGRTICQQNRIAFSPFSPASIPTSFYQTPLMPYPRFLPHLVQMHKAKLMWHPQVQLPATHYPGYPGHFPNPVESVFPYWNCASGFGEGSTLGLRSFTLWYSCWLVIHHGLKFCQKHSPGSTPFIKIPYLPRLLERRGAEPQIACGYQHFWL